MNVRKPLLSTSALKHRGVTIIFNHDYDRIIFRNETVNLVSHDCHSYLHVVLTNGIPPCKTLVMAGENATNDVDEEVYDNDTGVHLSVISPAIPFAIRYAGFVLSRFTVRPDGRTPFQYLLGTP